MAPTLNQKEMTGHQNSWDSLLPDFPEGPLSRYRKKASFNWKEMAVFIDGEDIIQLKVNYEIKKIIKKIMKLRNVSML